MPSPFPGMDPFIESQDWTGFHADLLPVVREMLMPALYPTYVCQLKDYIYARIDRDSVKGCSSTPGITHRGDMRSTGESNPAGTMAPVVLTLPEYLCLPQSYLSIRNAQTRELVTVIELISPWNKTKPDGQAAYLTKRFGHFRASASVVEIDLLCGGARLPVREPLPTGDYYCYVSRPTSRPRVDVYSWELRDRLPVIPVPLSTAERDVALDLQTAFNRVYDRSGYKCLIDYEKPVSPAMTDAGSAWVTSCLIQWPTQ